MAGGEVGFTNEISSVLAPLFQSGESQIGAVKQPVPQRLSHKKYQSMVISYLSAMLFIVSQPNMTQLGFDIFRNLD
jgi:hypothetical protein